MSSDRIHIDEKEFNEALGTLNKMHRSLDPRYMKNTQARIARRIIVPAMKARSKSSDIEKMINVTTAKKRAGDLGVKTGVVKNDKTLFPKISAPALAAIIEYGTAERYRQLKSMGLVTGRQSTGKMPEAPFLRPAWDATVQKFMKEAEEAFQNRVMSAV